MREYLVELSKFFITGFMALYALSCYAVFFIPEEKHRRKIYLAQNLLMFLVQGFCFFDLTAGTGDIQYFLLFAFVQVFLIFTLVMVGAIYKKCSRPLLNHMCMLLGIGLVMIARLSFERAVRQYVIIMLSMIVSLLIPFLFSEVRFLKRITWLYAAVGITLLGIVLFMGEITHGSNIRMEIAGVAFQPSEFVKILYIFFLAGALWEDTSLRRVAVTAVLAGVHVLILVFSTDLGGALIYFAVYVLAVLAATGNYLYLLAGAAGGGAAAFAAYRLFAHVRVRVLAWRDPWRYIDAQGYQITQSLFAIGGGGWFGMGLLRGNPRAIPYVSVDFIFSSLCEELGVVFGICLILVCISCFVTMMQIAIGILDRFYQIIVYGIGTMYIFQIFLTIGGGIKFIPLTGVTLPFISYGGSSVMSTMIMFFIVQGIHIRMQRKEAGQVAKIRPETEQAAKAEQETAQAAKIRQETEQAAKIRPETVQAAKTGKTENFREIMLTMCLFCGIFAIMTVYLVHFTATGKQELLNNSYNSRQELLLSRNCRGMIFSRDGEVLAETVSDEEQGETRVYPFSNLFAHVVGYSTRGRMGVEAQANYYLINSSIPLAGRAANEAAGVKNPGDNVYTTLDVQLQQVADDQLSVYKGAVIVTEVATGKILALVSHPDFDPNEIGAIWSDLLADRTSTVLLNRATQGLYPPGSTFKIVTALEYIRENPLTWQDYRFSCGGSFQKENSRISCYHGTKHGNIDFEASFAKSCNSSFANIGTGLDGARFQKTLDGLLFGQELPLTMPYAKSAVELSETSATGDRMQTAIGQGKTQITPMHLNMITCAIANDGILMTPYVIDRVENDEGGLVKTFKSSSYGRLMTSEEAEALRGLMTAVVKKGTGSKLNGLDYTAAGKTGSAEYSNRKGESHAWFTGFAPAEEPEVCVTIIVEGAGSGGEYAVPIARRLFDAYFREKAGE